MTNVHCTQAIESHEIPRLMQAVQQRRYGDADVLELVETEVPTPDTGEVLVEVYAASLNPLDWHFMTGTPWFLRLIAGLRAPKQATRGADVAGVVVAVGGGVTDFAIGDRVFGGGPGTFADFVACSVDRIARIPDGVDMASAAALPVAAVTALQGLRDHGHAADGTSVLINGAAGGVGTSAVQIAKHLGASVTGVCSTGNVEMVRDLGADHVVDYTVEDITTQDRTFDVILDNVGNWRLRDCKRLLVDGGVLIGVSGPKRNRLWGPAGRILRTLPYFAFGSRRAVTFTADETSGELRVLADLVHAGALSPAIERTYRLDEVRDGMEYLSTGHARAKLVIEIRTEAAE